jgi:hypothetical protein
MVRSCVAFCFLGLSAGCVGHEVGRAPAQVAPRLASESREVATLDAVPTEGDEAVDDEVKQREARLKLAQARAAGCGVGLR